MRMFVPTSRCWCSTRDGKGIIPAWDGGDYSEMPGYFQTYGVRHGENTILHSKVHSDGLVLPSSVTLSYPTGYSEGGSITIKPALTLDISGVNAMSGMLTIGRGAIRLRLSGSGYNYGTTMSSMIHCIDVVEFVRDGERDGYRVGSYSFSFSGRIQMGKWGDIDVVPNYSGDTDSEFGYLCRSVINRIWSDHLVTTYYPGDKSHVDWTSFNTAFANALKDRILTGWRSLLSVAVQPIEYRTNRSGTLYANPTPSSRWEFHLASGISNVVLPGVPGLDSFKLNETSIFASRQPNELVAGAVQDAYVQAVRSVPRANDNNIANIKQIVDAIRHILTGRLSFLPKDVADLWLGYRYSYSTTKLDIKENLSYLKRVGQLKDHIKCYGIVNSVINGQNVTVRVCLKLKNRNISALNTLLRNVYSFGLKPTAYSFWDSVPYSFIVDWFVPIGDALSAWDAHRAVAQYYDIDSVVYSLKYIVTDPLTKSQTSCYTRWVGPPPRYLNLAYLLDDSSHASGKTVIYRILDSGSIVLKAAT